MPTQGTLIVRVYTSQAQLPVEGATVVVTTQGRGGKQNLLSVQATDSSGLIQPVSIQTPGPGESTQPGGVNGGVPFALTTVWAEHPGYAMLQMEGVQVFPGVETVQNVELVPLAEGETSLQQRGVREITAQNL